MYKISLNFVLIITFMITKLAAASQNKFVILATSPNAPYDKILYDVPVANRVIIVDGERFSKDDIESYSKLFKEVICIKNYLDSCAVDKALYDLYASGFKFGKIIAPAECDLIRAARARDYFNISGQSCHSALAFRDKILMKKILEEKGMKVPKHRKIESVFDILEFGKEHGYPLIIKPTRGYGANRTEKIQSSEDVEGLAEKGFFNCDYITDL
jgi:hypothetical protein